MLKWEIISAPDRLDFVNSQFKEIDSVPMPGMLPPPQSRGGIKAPSYRGESFLVKDENGKEREVLLIITGTKRRDRSGMFQEFTAVLWTVCSEFQDLASGDPYCTWIGFKGKWNFACSDGDIEQIKL